MYDRKEEQLEGRKKDKLNDINRSRRGSAIIDGKQDNLRQDGYTNLLNKYGTAQDNSMAYSYEQEPITADMELVRLYEGNGLFSKIIDRPAEEAVKHGLDIDYGDDIIAEYVEERLDELDFEEKFATAEKWARLYGGALIVMLCDDGGSLEEPLDYDKVRTIEELRVFERAIVQEDYQGLYQSKMIFSNSDLPIGQPEFYHINSIYGSFTVHYTRCLIFRNGRLPEQTTNSIYRHWGMPEHVKIKQALRECMTSHSNGTKLLERSVQAIYKMKNLATLLSSDEGEGKVLQRLQVIDMARGILNSMAIDAEGEDYDFKTLQMAGVKDVIDTTCNMLSAVTNIPQTILFGRSPAGMNATGDSDLENYYNMVENIQKQNMKKNIRTLIDLILKQGFLEGEIQDIPKFKVKFSALWSLSDTEKADIEQKKAQTEQIKAQLAQAYIDAGVLDPSEVRKSLAINGDFNIEELIDEDDIELPEDNGNESTQQNKEKNIDDFDFQISSNIQEDGRCNAAAVLVIKDGKILCAKRNDSEFLCGPGGHIEEGEQPEEAALREAQEEFNIVPLNILPLGIYKCTTGLYCNSKLYFTDQFKGIPKADGIEMVDARWLSLEELNDELLFPPFAESICILENLLKNKLTKDFNMGSLNVDNIDGGEGSGNFGHKGVKGQQGGSAKQGGGSKNSSSSSESKESNKKAKKSEKSGSKESSSGEENKSQTRKTKKEKHEKEGSGNKESLIKKNVEEKPQKEKTTVSEEPEGEKAEKTTALPKPSARGKNIPCKGFASKDLLAGHFSDHGKELKCKTEDEYLEKAKDFISKECGGDIDGYITKYGEVCRFNIKTGEYGKGIPGGIIRTYFIAKYSEKTGQSNLDIANKYFYRLKERDGVEDEET